METESHIFVKETGDFNNNDFEIICEKMDSSFSDVDIELYDTFIFEYSDSDAYEFGNEEVASDFSLFESYCDINNIVKTDTNMPYELDDKKNLDISPSTSPFDTHNFPTSVNDISTWLDGDKYIFASTEESNQANTSVECDQVNTVIPEIKIKQEIDTSTSEENDEESEEDSYEARYLQPPPKRQRLQNRKYSSTDSDSDEDWDPESVSNNDYREKNQMPKKKSLGISRRKPNPIPQRRAPGTKQKITQWIVGLLRDPRYNPKVLTWLDEKVGMFQIKDTAAYAKLWGKVKGNPNMTYEKLSRAMRYSYKNQELHMVPELRLTYKFGKNMVDFRAKDSSDPNFEKIHRKQQPKSC